MNDFMKVSKPAYNPYSNNYFLSHNDEDDKKD